MHSAFSRVFTAALWAASSVVLAQIPPPPLSHDVVQFSVTASIDARQDELSLTLAVTREGSEPLAVQTQIKRALEDALTQARAMAKPGEMEVRSGNFSLQPRHGRDGRISNWQGTAELVLWGRDFERIASAAGRIPGMTVRSVVFGLSRAQREQLESQAQAQAIERFRARAGDIAKGFGFTTYALREISISSQDHGLAPQPRFMAMEMRSAVADAPLPLEAGKATVQVSVSGAVQLK